MEEKKSWWQRFVLWLTYRGSDAEHEARTCFVVELMIGKMLEEEEVLIYSDSLKPTFFTEALISSSCRFRILIGNTLAMGVLSALPKKVRDRIDCRVSNTPRGKHFIVAGNSFRSELKDCNDEMYAVVNFNEEEVAQKLRTRFESMWETAIPFQTC